ncbi:MAG: prephenate dehydrogenase [Chloroflexia bacterium]
MPQITIIGLGAVGSSLGMALKRSMQAPGGKTGQFTIVGYDPDLDTLKMSQQQDMSIDRAAGDLASAVREASFVIVATPTRQLRETLAGIAPHLPEGATVTDTAPAKRLALQWAGELLPSGVSFVGGHPLLRRQPGPSVKSEEVLDEPPDADLFVGAPYCIMPLGSASEAAVNQVIGMAESVGARPYFTDPWEHDSFQAAINDLPIVMSYGLMRLLSSSPSWDDMHSMAGAAFREATRFASTDPLAVRADLVANRENLLGWIDRYQLALQELRDMLAETNPGDLQSGAGRELGGALIAGRNARTRWLNPKAAPTEGEIEAKESERRRQPPGFMRSMLGGAIADRFTGEADRDKKK